MDKVVALCKRRGFVYPSSEIYGGLNAVYDYGPYGVAMKRAIKDLWWRRTVDLRDDVVGLDASVLMNPEVWVASGHVAGFSDPLVDCLGTCRKRWRADHLSGDRCPECGGPLSAPRQFNLMFKTHIGPVEDEGGVVYLRPETAQGMFVDFKSVLNSMRVRLPFGIAQQGRSFRNEISPGNFIFRLREFEQMEMEYFVKPGEDERWHAYWIKERHDWYLEDLGITPGRLRLREHGADERAHYAKASTDIEYEYPFGWGELEGVANRTDFDLRAHQEHAHHDLTYLDQETNERYLPYAIEPAVGVDRIRVMALLDAYDEEEVRGDTRVVLRLHPNVAPVQVAVMPLSKKESLIDPARKVQAMLRRGYRVEYDQTGGNIGRRYRRQDEIGTPYCVTVDFDTLEDQAVTIRERDSMEQERVPIADLVGRIGERLG
ncbi:MAG: glycine--tRNA ligase [Candidatus Dormibacteraceae bacterium]